MFYYQHHIGDYLSHTANLSLLEHGVYTRLLQTYYMTEKPIPLDDPWRTIGARDSAERSAVEYILTTFFTKTEDGYVQSRCNKELNSYKEKSQKASKSAKVRWDSYERNANAMRTHSEGNANGMLTINHKPLTNKPIKKKEYPTPDGVSDSVWQDFLQISKAKKSPMTATALKGIEREASKAGMTLSEAITSCCELGWARFNAGWYAERMAKKVNNVVGVESFRERDQKAKRAQMERDFPNLVNPQEKNNVPSLTLG